jgi:dTDP-4-dehydrorhamnose 3,5-epimerase
MPANVEASTRIAGVYSVRLQRHGDDRGFFYESFRRTWVPDIGEMVQGNFSFSKAGVLRGLHYHHKQADLWFCPLGHIRAGLYDLRTSSPTRGNAETYELGAAEARVLYIPRGVAHGFYAVEDSYLSYLVDQYYDGSDELGVKWDDPALGVPWGVTTASLSDRDAKNPPLADIPVDRRPR